MSYINFDKSKLVNLEYSLNKEYIHSSRTGAFSCTTIIECNTRKYHGLLICPQPNVDNENHVLLSSFDVSVVQRDAQFNLGIHKYPELFNPKGHKYIIDYSTEPIPKITYRVGGVVLTKEMIFSSESDRVMIRYTLLEAHSPTKLKFNPFLAFRCVHKLTKENIHADTHFVKIENGIKLRMYPGYSFLHMQFSKDVEYTHVPHWYYNIEYIEEKNRGYECIEDLFVPGFFEADIKKGESIVFSAGTEEINTENLKRAFTAEIKKRIPRDNFKNCLQNSAQQFIVRKDKKTEIIAGFPWFGRWGRDTFIALPGLTLANGDVKTCKSVIDTMLAELKGPLFPNIGSGYETSYNSVDAPLWFFRALQQYAEVTDTKHQIWEEYGKKLKMILNGFRNGTEYNIKMLENGLIYAGIQGKALTWMDAVVNGKPVTPRIGLPVEINALWYNAVMFTLEIAELAGDNDFIKEWLPVAVNIPAEFKATFWNKDKGYLCDYVHGVYKDWAVRPNMIFAASLPYSPVSEQIRKLIVDKIERELLTPRGLRTLSPTHPDYKGNYAGDQATRDNAYHQGTVWPWLLGHYAEAYLRLMGKLGVPYVKRLYEAFEPEMKVNGIGTISEIYDGDPPHNGVGAISQAWSVAELLRMEYMIRHYSKTNKPATRVSK